MELSRWYLRQVAESALEEDLAWGDVTTDSLVPDDLRGRATFVSKAEGVLAGVPVASEVFRLLDPKVEIRRLVADGQWMRPGQELAVMQGRVAPILRGERVALNFLQRMSGTATLTARFVEAVRGSKAKVIDTRKTTPGLRRLERYAVRMGGGHNHRFSLADGVLIKDNHLVSLAREGKGIAEAIQTARDWAPHTVRVQVECETLEQVREAAEAGAEAILVDNMSVEQIREAVKIVAGRALVEASGGVTLERARAIAEAGVDLMSSGQLTHSAPALDISLELEVD